MAETKIDPVKTNQEKYRTYRQQKGRYKRAVQNGFYFEALMIDYALIEDRLTAYLYHLGIIRERSSDKACAKAKRYLRNELVVHNPKFSELRVRNIFGKLTTIREVLTWATETEKNYTKERYLNAIVIQCRKANVPQILQTLEAISKWKEYRNEIVHGLMNKNADTLAKQEKEIAEQGMKLADRLDTLLEPIKKNDRIRKAARLPSKK